MRKVPVMSQDDPRSRLLSEALELALDVAKEGADNLSQFLSEVNAGAYNIAEKAGAQMNQVSQEQRDKFAKQSGQSMLHALFTSIMPRQACCW